MKKAGKILLLVLSLFLINIFIINFANAGCVYWKNVPCPQCGSDPAHPKWYCGTGEKSRCAEEMAGIERCPRMDGYWVPNGAGACTCPNAVCSGSTPCGTPGHCSAKINYYKDLDNDKFSDGATSSSCTQPAGHKTTTQLSTLTGDCNDNDASIGLATIWYRDADGDGYGSATDTITSCTQPNGYIARNTDNNDSDDDVNPDAPEICSGAGRGVDNNQNGVIDEGCFYPAIFINSPAAGVVYNLSTLILDVTTNEDVDSCSYSLDGSLPLVMSQRISLTHYSQTINNPDEGSHTIIVTCADTDGWENSSSVTFGVDTIPPAINLISPSSVLYNTRDISVEITSDGTQQAIWYNWNGADNVYSVPEIVSFNEGWNTITAYVNDSIGNQNSVSFTFYVDTINPDITITNPAVDGMSFITNDIPVEYTMTDINAVSCWWTNNSGLENHTIICGDNITGQIWNDGQNFVSVFAEDILGRIGSDTRMFNIDSQAPAITILNPVSNGIYSSDVLLSATISDDNLDLATTRYEIREEGVSGALIDSGALNLVGVNYESTFIVESGWPHRNFTLIVYASDTGGRSSSASVDFVFDNTAVSITFINPLANGLSRFNSNFNLNIIANGYQLSSSSFTILDSLSAVILTNNAIPLADSYTWSDLVDISALSDGVYTVNADAADSSIPVKTAAETTSFTIDRSGPAVTINSPINGGIYNYSCINLDVVHNGVSAWFVWNGVNYTLPLTGCFDFDEGSNIIDIYVEDDTGNIYTQTITFIVDTIAPVVLFVLPTDSNGYLNRDNIIFNASASDLGAGIQNLRVQLTDILGSSVYDNTVAFSNLYDVITGLADGTYSLFASALDNAINTGVSETRTIIIDTTNPTITVVNPENKTYATSTIPLEISSDESLSSCTYSLDGGTTTIPMNLITPTSFSETLLGLADGGYAVIFSCADLAGNSGTGTAYFSIDTTAPALTIISPEAVTYDRKLINVNITADETAQLVWYSWGGNDYAYNAPEDVLFPRGDNSLTAFANDSYGNLNSASVNFGVYPLITIINSTIYDAFYPANTNDEVTTTTVTNSIINWSNVIGEPIVEITNSYLDNSNLINVLLIYNCTAINATIFGGNCQDSIIIASIIINSTLNQTNAIFPYHSKRA